MQAENHQKQETMQTDSIREHQRKVRMEANVSIFFPYLSFQKIRLEMYHEMKAVEIMEQQAMVPKKMKMRNFRKQMNNSVDFQNIDGFRNNNTNWTISKNEEPFDSQPLSGGKSPVGSPQGNKDKMIRIHQKNVQTDRKVR